MGSLLLASGEKGKRHCLPNASIMIHRTSSDVDLNRPYWSTKINFDLEPSGGASGQASDIAIHAKEILRIRQLLTGIYQRHCGKDGETQSEGLARFGDYKFILFTAHSAVLILTLHHLKRGPWSEIIIWLVCLAFLVLSTSSLKRSTVIQPKKLRISALWMASLKNGQPRRLIDLSNCFLSIYLRNRNALPC